VTRARAYIALSLAVWVACFAVLARTGTWLPFAFSGVTLVAVGVFVRAVPVGLLWASPRRVAAGLVSGGVMVLLTHLAFALLVAGVPGIRYATLELFDLLNVIGFSPTERTALIVLVASCEELIFRGPLLDLAPRPAERSWRRPTRQELVRVASFAAAYALTTVPLASPLLVLCALLCGSLWGLMTVVSSSLTVPLLAHVIWDLGVLVVWPLSAQG